LPGIFKGKLREIRLYNYELPPDDILNLSISDGTKFSGQIGGWPFDEGSGVTTADSTMFPTPERSTMPIGRLAGSAPL
jgi:hypothetical protein